MQIIQRNRARRCIVIGLSVAVFGYVFVLAGSWAVRAWHLQRGMYAMDASDFDQARNRFHAAEFWADDAQLQILLARIARRSDDFKEMEHRLRRALEMGALEVSLTNERILAEAQSGYPDRNAAQLGPLLDNTKTRAEFAEVCDAFVRGYIRQANFGRALQLLKSWQGRYPDSIRPVLWRASIRRELQQFPEAAIEFRRVLELVPDHDEARGGLANVLLQQGLVHEAELHFRQYLAGSPDDLPALLGLADCLFGRGELREAGQIYAEVVKSDDQHVSARRGLGRIALQEGRTRDALKWLLPAVELAPRDTAILYNIGAALRAEGRKEDASEYFDRVHERQQHMARFKALADDIQRDPDDIKSRYELGRLILEQFEPNDSLVWFQSVLFRKPDHKPTHRALAEYYNLSGKHALAAYHSSKTASAK